MNNRLKWSGEKFKRLCRLFGHITRLHETSNFAHLAKKELPKRAFVSVTGGLKSQVNRPDFLNAKSHQADFCWNLWWLKVEHD